MAKKDELNFENGNNMAGSEKLKALQAAMDKIEKSFGKGSIMKMGDESVEHVEDHAGNPCHRRSTKGRRHRSIHRCGTRFRPLLCSQIGCRCG